ncbi:hypothetical protein AVEN_236195-1, partial [Araneus ventricosus]
NTMAILGINIAVLNHGPKRERHQRQRLISKLPRLASGKTFGPVKFRVNQARIHNRFSVGCDLAKTLPPGNRGL